LASDVRTETSEIGGLCNIASQELQMIRFLANPERDWQRIRIRASALAVQIRAAAQDYEQLTAHREVQIRIEESFNRLSAIAIEIIPELLETAVRCILDNAVKYSYEKTTAYLGAEQVLFTSLSWVRSPGNGRRTPSVALQ
jgi:hypothetical protein